MRLILLMHPEYQINNKLLDKKVLVNAKLCNEVAEEQHGSRRHHQAGLLGLNKVLIGDIFRYTRGSDCYVMNTIPTAYRLKFAVIFVRTLLKDNISLVLILQRLYRSKTQKYNKVHPFDQQTDLS